MNRPRSMRTRRQYTQRSQSEQLRRRRVIWHGYGEIEMEQAAEPGIQTPVGLPTSASQADAAQATTPVTLRALLLVEP